jgi:hypothetical protein
MSCSGVNHTLPIETPPRLTGQLLGVVMRLGRVCRPPKNERVAAKHPATLDRRFIHPGPEKREE